MASRRGSRKLALDILYEHELTGAKVDELLARAQKNPAYPYTEVLVRGVIAHQSELDGTISALAKDWATDRMPVIDLCVMRMAAFEILQGGEVPAAVVIDEAVALAKIYSTEDSGRFVNGVLAAIAGTKKGEDKG